MVPWRWRPKSISKAPTQVKPETQAADSTADEVQHQFQRNALDERPPEQQSALLLHAIRQPYEVALNHAVPQIQSDEELLVKVAAVGLNPVDWKSP